MRLRRPDLSGLTAAIRLKTALLQELATRPSAEWPEDVDRFIAAVESCDLGDATALLVLLADLKEGIRVFTGFQGSGDPVSEPGPALPEGLSKREILAQFRLEIADRLRASGRHTPVVSAVVERLTHFIEKNYAARITLEMLAAAVGRSKRHVATLFRQQTGHTIHHYLTQVRVHHAAALIRQGEKIEAVSLLVGYRSKKNFYRQFKRQIGVTPIVYKTAVLGLVPRSESEPAAAEAPKR